LPNVFESGKKVAIIHTWRFDVDYFFHPRWSIALQGDIKLQSFKVEDGKAIMERGYPFAFNKKLW
jgi:hypothetical protein